MKKYQKRENYIPNNHQQQIFDDYLISQNGTITGKNFGISRQRVSQITKLFGYIKPQKKKIFLSEDEKKILKEERKALRTFEQTSLFWSHVDIKSDNECWEWKLCRYPEGYGKTQIKITNSNYAHRVAWILTNGEIPNGKNILHTCDNPPCCNPKHLYAGTQLDNCRDRQERFYQNGKIPLHIKDRSVV